MKYTAMTKCALWFKFDAMCRQNASKSKQLDGLENVYTYTREHDTHNKKLVFDLCNYHWSLIITWIMIAINNPAQAARISPALDRTTQCLYTRMSQITIEQVDCVNVARHVLRFQYMQTTTYEPYLHDCVHLRSNIFHFSHFINEKYIVFIIYRIYMALFMN